jgi:hypothetical protein
MAKKDQLMLENEKTKGDILMVQGQSNEAFGIG